jgi:imidazolonepropionase-like amidohydrolase
MKSRPFTVAIRVGGDMQANFAKAFKAGVKIAYGTDSGVSAHGDNAKQADIIAIDDSP